MFEFILFLFISFACLFHSIVPVNILTENFISHALIIFDKSSIMNNHILCHNLVDCNWVKTWPEVNFVEFLLQDRTVQMKFIVKFGKVGLFHIKKSVGSGRWLFHIDDDLILKNFSGVDVKSVPLIIISAVTPIMPTHSITSMDKDVHQVILLLSALYLVKLGFNFG